MLKAAQIIVTIFWIVGGAVVALKIITFIGMLFMFGGTL